MRAIWAIVLCVLIAMPVTIVGTPRTVPAAESVPWSPAPALSGNITSNTTFVNETVYWDGNLTVSNATLTLDNATLVVNGTVFTVLVNGSLVLANSTLRGNVSLMDMDIAGPLAVENGTLRLGRIIDIYAINGTGLMVVDSGYANLYDGISGADLDNVTVVLLESGAFDDISIDGVQRFYLTDASLSDATIAIDSPLFTSDDVDVSGDSTISNLTVTGGQVNLRAPVNITDLSINDSFTGLNPWSGGVFVEGLNITNCDVGVDIGGPIDIRNATFDGLPFFVRDGMENTTISGPLADGIPTDRGAIVLWNASDVTIQDAAWTGDGWASSAWLSSPDNVTLRNLTFSEGGDGLVLSGDEIGDGLILDNVSLSNLTGVGLRFNDNLAVTNLGGLSVDGQDVHLHTGENVSLDGVISGGQDHTDLGDLVVLGGSLDLTLSTLTAAPAAYFQGAIVNMTNTNVAGDLLLVNSTLVSDTSAILTSVIDLVDSSWQDTDSIIGPVDGSGSVILENSSLELTGTDLRSALDALNSTVLLHELPIVLAEHTFNATLFEQTWSVRYHPSTISGTEVAGWVNISGDGQVWDDPTSIELIGPRLGVDGVWDNVTYTVRSGNTTHTGFLAHTPDLSGDVPIILATLDMTSPVIPLGTYASSLTTLGACSNLSAGNTTDDLFLLNVTYEAILNSTVSLSGVDPWSACWEEPGLWAVTATATDGAGNSVTEPFTVTVVDDEDPVANVSLPDTVLPGLGFVLDGAASTDNHRIVNWSWEVSTDPVTVLYGVSPSMNLSEAGDYTATLTVTDPSGHVDLAVARFSVRDLLPPEALFSLVVEAHLGTMLLLDGRNSTDNGRISDYRWTIGHETPRTLAGSKVAFTFSQVGLIDVTLTVTDSAGNNDRLTQRIAIIDTEPPRVEASTLDPEIQLGAEILLSSVGTTDNDAIQSFFWTFFDGTRDRNISGANVWHTFTEAGNYTPTLWAVDRSGNVGSASMWVLVTERFDPIARFPPTADGYERTHDVAYVGELYVMSANHSTDDIGIVNWTWTMTHAGREIVRYGPIFSFLFNTTDSGVSLDLEVFDGDNRSDKARMLISVRASPNGEPDDTGLSGASLTWVILAVTAGVLIVATFTALIIRDIRRKRVRRVRRKKRVSRDGHGHETDAGHEPPSNGDGPQP